MCMAARGSWRPRGAAGDERRARCVPRAGDPARSSSSPSSWRPPPPWCDWGIFRRSGAAQSLLHCGPMTKYSLLFALVIPVAACGNDSGGGGGGGGGDDQMMPDASTIVDPPAAGARLPDQVARRHDHAGAGSHVLLLLPHAEHRGDGDQEVGVGDDARQSPYDHVHDDLRRDGAGHDQTTNDCGGFSINSLPKAGRTPRRPRPRRSRLPTDDGAGKPPRSRDRRRAAGLLPDALT